MYCMDANSVRKQCYSLQEKQYIYIYITMRSLHMRIFSTIDQLWLPSRAPKMGPRWAPGLEMPAQPPHNPPFEAFQVRDSFLIFLGGLGLPSLESPLAICSEPSVRTAVKLMHCKPTCSLQIQYYVYCCDANSL